MPLERRRVVPKGVRKWQVFAKIERLYTSVRGRFRQRRNRSCVLGNAPSCPPFEPLIQPGDRLRAWIPYLYYVLKNRRSIKNFENGHGFELRSPPDCRRRAGGPFARSEAC